MKRTKASAPVVAQKLDPFFSELKEEIETRQRLLEAELGEIESRTFYFMITSYSKSGGPDALPTEYFHVHCWDGTKRKRKKSHLSFDGYQGFVKLVAVGKPLWNRRTEIRKGLYNLKKRLEMLAELAKPLPI